MTPGSQQPAAGNQSRGVSGARLVNAPSPADQSRGASVSVSNGPGHNSGDLVRTQSDGQCQMSHEM